MQLLRSANVSCAFHIAIASDNACFHGGAIRQETRAQTVQRKTKLLSTIQQNVRMKTEKKGSPLRTPESLFFVAFGLLTSFSPLLGASCPTWLASRSLGPTWAPGQRSSHESARWPTRSGCFCSIRSSLEQVEVFLNWQMDMSSRNFTKHVKKEDSATKEAVFGATSRPATRKAAPEQRKFAPP